MSLTKTAKMKQLSIKGGPGAIDKLQTSTKTHNKNLSTIDTAEQIKFSTQTFTSVDPFVPQL